MTLTLIVIIIFFEFCKFFFSTLLSLLLVSLLAGLIIFSNGFNYSNSFQFIAIAFCDSYICSSLKKILMIFFSFARFVVLIVVLLLNLVDDRL